jgi:hypothetical protein
MDTLAFAKPRISWISVHRIRLMIKRAVILIRNTSINVEFRELSGLFRIVDWSVCFVFVCFVLSLYPWGNVRNITLLPSLVISMHTSYQMFHSISTIISILLQSFCSVLRTWGLSERLPSDSILSQSLDFLTCVTTVSCLIENTSLQSASGLPLQCLSFIGVSFLSQGVTNPLLLWCSPASSNKASFLIVWGQ